MKSKKSLVVYCSKDATVQSILNDTLDLPLEVSCGNHFKNGFSSVQQKTIETFFDEIHNNGAAYDFRIYLEDQGHDNTLHLNGGLTPENSIIVFCSLSNKAMDEKFFDELIRINNEQVNQIRQYASKEASSSPLEEDKLYSKLSRLNNELINTQRELAIKNQKLERANSDLEAANKSLEAFNYIVSHDLKSPLRHVTGFAKMLSTKYESAFDEKGAFIINTIIESTEKMKTLVDSLLELSRIESAEIVKSNVNLSSLAEKVRQEITDYGLEKDVDFQIESGLSAACDKNLVEIVLDNLFRNACKYSAKTDKPKVIFGQNRINGQDVFSVSDNGVGFAQELSDTVFEPFKRLHSKYEYEGFGIGLSTVKKIIDRHGGSIWAESEEGKGATFYFTLE